MTDEQLNSLSSRLNRATLSLNTTDSLIVFSVDSRYKDEIKRLRPMEQKLQRIRDIVNSDDPERVQLVKIKSEIAEN